ncbi:hypothetical protein KIH39_03360 [Telmatocola sphagniphila]|uniref:Uncharacterized protein n=1 Tax=Telmatocola sphagniphila TaxID=1123043 RepID=A0A8E6B6U9_9BACT|nr:hypothetical protein [Telmatocola sphagniphila]QVL32968.1 hypothetical protein KIH39_03360 [Telmatocola sphagniphila]
MAPENESIPRKSPCSKLASVALGIFFLFQIIFLIVGNVIQYLPRQLSEHRAEPFQKLGRLSDSDLIQEPVEAVGWFCDRWTELTGEWQGWSMFAPVFPHRGVFPVVVMHFEESSKYPDVTLSEDFTPDNPEHYFQLTDSRHRRFNYETRMSAPFALIPEDPKNPGQWDPRYVDRWNSEIETYVQLLHRQYSSYLRWRISLFLKDHPDYPMPETVELKIHIIPTPDPNNPNTVETQQTIPYLRWTPAEVSDKYLPLEYWDLIEMKFKKLVRKELP